MIADQHPLLTLRLLQHTHNIQHVEGDMSTSSPEHGFSNRLPRTRPTTSPVDADKMVRGCPHRCIHVAAVPKQVSKVCKDDAAGITFCEVGLSCPCQPHTPPPTWDGKSTGAILRKTSFSAEHAKTHLKVSNQEALKVLHLLGIISADVGNQDIVFEGTIISGREVMNRLGPAKQKPWCMTPTRAILRRR